MPSHTVPRNEFCFPYVFMEFAYMDCKLPNSFTAVPKLDDAVEKIRVMYILMAGFHTQP